MTFRADPNIMTATQQPAKHVCRTRVPIDPGTKMLSLAPLCAETRSVCVHTHRSHDETPVLRLPTRLHAHPPR
jgi:hypothetical protein